MSSRLIRLAALAGGLAVAPCAFATPPAAPHDSFGIRLVAVAADFSSSYIVERVAPGATVLRRVEITNNTSTFREIAVYPAAADLRQGRFAFGPGRRRNELSRWTSVGATVLGLPPGPSASTPSAFTSRATPRAANATPSSGPSYRSPRPPRAALPWSTALASACTSRSAPVARRLRASGSALQSRNEARAEHPLLSHRFTTRADPHSRSKAASTLTRDREASERGLSRSR